MAFQTGSSLGHLALLTDLSTFLVAQSWTVEKDTTVGSDREVYFKGPDITAGAITINAHVNIHAFEDVPGDRYNWEVRGAIGFDTLESFDTQPQVSPRSGEVVSTVPMFQNNIDYWFIANDRRFIVIAKVSTVFTSMYGGFLLPYATPTEFPFPIYIGATTGIRTQRFSQSDYQIGGMWDPTVNSSYIRHYDGSWFNVTNYTNSGGLKSRGPADSYIWPYRDAINDQVINNIDGTYSLLSCVLTSKEQSGNVYGELEGVFSCSGFANAAENTVTISAVDYVVIQCANRTDVEDYVCIRLQ